MVATRMNARHQHCYVDEDSMRYVKKLALAAPCTGSGAEFERFILRISRLRMKLASKRNCQLNKSAAKRSRR